MNQNLPQDIDRENLNQLSKQELVEIIIEQSKVIGEFWNQRDTRSITACSTWLTLGCPRRVGG